MGSHAAKLVAALCALASALIGASSAGAAPFLDGTFPLQAEVGTNNKIVAGPDGNVWLTIEDATNDVAKVTPGGQVEEFDIDGILSPEGIAPGPDGNLWITDVEKAARFNPGNPTGSDESFTVAGVGANAQIVAGPDGQMWVASGNSLVHFNPTQPTLTAQPVIVNGTNFSPKDIDVVGQLIVIADQGENRVVTFTTAGVQKDFPIAGGAQGVAGSPSGQIAYSAPEADPEQVGLITPPSPAQPIPVPGDPFGVAWGADQAFWVVQFAQGGLTRFTPGGETQFLGGLPIEKARQVTPGPNNTLWVTLGKAMESGAVVRVSGVDPPATNSPPPPPPPSVPQTTIGKGPKKVVKTRKRKAKVKFRFSSSSASATFECSLTRLKGKKTKVGSFRPCKSPKTYKLRPGKYRFQVRAVLGGVRDKTPAASKFKIVRIR